MEKMGNTQFRVIEAGSDRSVFVNNQDYLTPLQEREMSTQPDMILQFAQFLKNEFEHAGFNQPKVLVDSKVTLNGRKSELFIDPTIDIASQEESWKPKTWILRPSF